MTGWVGGKGKTLVTCCCLVGRGCGRGLLGPVLVLVSGQMGGCRWVLALCNGKV